MSIDKPDLDLATVPDDLVACLNANTEGFLAVPCDDPLVNAQSLVTLVLTDQQAAAAAADYDGFSSGQAVQLCQSAVATAFPSVDSSGAKAALPIAFAFTGTFDCYVDHAAGTPFIT